MEDGRRDCLVLYIRQYGDNASPVKARAFLFMTLDTMIVLMDDMLSYDLDNFKRRDGHTPTAEEKTAQINYGLRTIGRYICMFDPAIVMVPTAESYIVNLRDSDVVSRKVLEVKQVIINGSVLGKPNKMKGLWNIGDVERLASNWRRDTSGVPNKAWQLGTDLYLHLKPNAAVVSEEDTWIAGTYMPDDLVYGENAEPDLPEELHEAAVRVAAIFAADPSAAEGEALNRLGRYSSQAYAMAKEIRIRNYKQMQAYTSEPGSSVPNFVYYG